MVVDPPVQAVTSPFSTRNSALDPLVVCGRAATGTEVAGAEQTFTELALLAIVSGGCVVVLSTSPVARYGLRINSTGRDLFGDASLFSSDGAKETDECIKGFSGVI